MTTSNPDKAFLETDYTNDAARASFRLRRDSQGNPKVEPIWNSPCSGTPCGAGPSR